MKLRQIKRKFKSSFSFWLIIFIAAITRLIWFDKAPGSITNDELHYILTVKSVALTGHDFSGSWNIFTSLIFTQPFGLLHSELPYLLLYPAISLTSFSIFTSRITYVIISIATVWVIFQLGRILFDKKTALIAAFLASINPWMIFIGRTTYEMVPATFFYFLGIYFLIKEKSWRILISLPIFFLAFYSYRPTKIIFIPIVLAVSIYAYFLNKKQFSKQYLILNIICLFLIIFYIVLQLNSSQEARLSEVFSPFSQNITNSIQARNSMVQNGLLAELFNSKFFIYSTELFQKSLQTLSPSYLFYYGDSFFFLRLHGPFYLLDAVFLLIGAAYLFIEKRKEFFLIFALSIIGIFPEIFFNSRVLLTHHIAIFIVLALFIIAYGVGRVGASKYKLIFIIFLYLISFINFFQIYFFQIPFKSQGSFSFATRELANYIKFEQKRGQKVNVYAATPQDAYIKYANDFNNGEGIIESPIFINGPEDLYTKYIYYTNNLDIKTYDQVVKSLLSQKYSIGKINFFACKDIESNYDPKAVTIYETRMCPPAKVFGKTYQIKNLVDASTIYIIYNGLACEKYKLNSYPKISFDDLSIERLSEKYFCEKFISK